MIVYNHRALHTSIWEKSPCSATSNRIEEEEYPCFIYFYFNNDCTNQISCMLNEYTKWKWGYFMFMSCREWKLLVLRNAMEQALWVITSFFYTQPYYKFDHAFAKKLNEYMWVSAYACIYTRVQKYRWLSIVEKMYHSMRFFFVKRMNQAEKSCRSFIFNQSLNI